MVSKIYLNKLISRDITKECHFRFSSSGEDGYYDVNAYYILDGVGDDYFNFSTTNSGKWVSFKKGFLTFKKGDLFRFESILDKSKVINLLQRQILKYKLDLETIKFICFTKNRVIKNKDKIIINRPYKISERMTFEQININLKDKETSFYYKNIFLFSISNLVISFRNYFNFSMKHIDFKGINSKYDFFNCSDNKFQKMDTVLVNININGKSIREKLTFKKKLNLIYIYYREKLLLKLNSQIYNLNINFIYNHNLIGFDKYVISFNQLDLCKYYNKYNNKSQRRKLFEIRNDCINYGITFEEISKGLL